MTFCEPVDQVQIRRQADRQRGAESSADAFGSTIDARELPRACKPPFRGRTVWEGTHREWRIVATRIAGDPLPHVVVCGHTIGGQYEIHAKRLEAATPATARAWIDELLAANTAIAP